MKKVRRIIKIGNKLKEYLTIYSAQHNISYSFAIRELAKAVNVDHRHIYAIINGNKFASSELQFTIANFFSVRVDEIFFPVMSSIGKLKSA